MCHSPSFPQHLTWCPPCSKCPVNAEAGKQRRGPGWEHNPKSPTSSLSPQRERAEKAQRADTCLLETLMHRKVSASYWLEGGSTQGVMCLLSCPQRSHGDCCLHSRPASSSRLLSCRFPGAPGTDGAARRFTAVPRRPRKTVKTISLQRKKSSQ